MTTLIDLNAPRYDLSESLEMRVDAAPARVLEAVDRLGRDPFAGIELLESAQGERVFALTWRTTPGAPGRVDIVWDVRVEPDEDGGSYLSSTLRFVARDEAARGALPLQWRYVRPVAETIAHRTLRTIKRSAEESPAAAPHFELALAA